MFDANNISLHGRFKNTVNNELIICILNSLVISKININVFEHLNPLAVFLERLVVSIFQ